MEGMFQKITYYDLYGYTFPGAILLLAMFSRRIYECGIDQVNLYKDLFIYIFMGYLLFSFIMGIIVSEIGHFVEILIFHKIRVGYLNQLAIPYALVEEALKAGVESASEITVSSGRELQAFLPYMYSVIQSDAKYSRIHNYASSGGMCRNLAVVSFLSGMIVRRDWTAGSWWPIAVGTVCAFIFWYRTYRFAKKKALYTIYWFVNRYIDGKTGD